MEIFKNPLYLYASRWIGESLYGDDDDDEDDDEEEEEEEETEEEEGKDEEEEISTFAVSVVSVVSVVSGSGFPADVVDIAGGAAPLIVPVVIVVSLSIISA